MWWSVAEGRRGRRWREALVGERGLRHALLLETAPDGRFSHLELATPAGLLTLHPEDDDTLHGNALAADGLRHVVGLPWASDGLVLVVGSPVALAALGHQLAGRPPDSDRRRRLLRISAGLDLAADDVELLTAGDGRWRLGDGPTVTADWDGLPALEDGAGWPLELGT